MVPESQSVAAIPFYWCQSLFFPACLLSALQESRFYTVHMHYVPCRLKRAAVTRHFSQHAGHPARTSLTHTIRLCGPCRRETDRWQRRGKASANGERDVSKLDSVISGKGRKCRKGRAGVRENPIKQKKACECGTLAIWWKQRTGREELWGVCECIYVKKAREKRQWEKKMNLPAFW